MSTEDYAVIDWWASAPGRSTCKKCGEVPPLVQETADCRGVHNFCMVCAHTWWVYKAGDGNPLRAAEYAQKYPNHFAKSA